MDVTVEIPGGRTEEVSLDGGTYGDLLSEVGLSAQEAAVLVDGRPVPEDEEVTATEVQVLRLISGGSRAHDARTSVTVRAVQPGEIEAAIALLDGAMLSFDRSVVRERANTDDVLVAIQHGSVRGALVLAGRTVTAIAVDPGFRDRGIGRALVAEAVARRGRLEALFDRAVRPFYASLGFEIRSDGERYVGVLRGLP